MAPKVELDQRQLSQKFPLQLFVEPLVKVANLMKSFDLWMCFTCSANGGIHWWWDKVNIAWATTALLQVKRQWEEQKTFWFTWCTW